MWPFRRKNGGVLPGATIASPMPEVAPPATERRDVVERLREPETRSYHLVLCEDGTYRDPLKVEAAKEIERLRYQLSENPRGMVNMSDAVQAYRLILDLIDGLTHLSGMQQSFDDRVASDSEAVVVTSACRLYTGLTGVKISPIDTFKKMDAMRAERNSQ